MNAMWGADENFLLLVYAVWIGILVPAFRRIVQTPISGSIKKVEL